MKKLLVLIIAAVLGFGFIAYAASAKADAANQDETIAVQNVAGQDVGTVSNALVDPSGNIIFIIVSLREEIGHGKDIAVPVAAFSYDSGNRILVVNLSNAQLELAPEFTASDLGDAEFAERVYQFYGQAPAWRE